MSAGLPIKDIIEWDVPNWSRLMDLWQPLIETLPKTARVLAIGERNGGMALWLALLGFTVECSDRMENFDVAKALHRRYGVIDRITYKALDIVHTATPANTYDLIIAKSVIGGLKANPADPATRNFDVQCKAVHNIHTLLAPGGYFLSAENLTGSFITGILRRVAGKNKGWRYLNVAELSPLFKDFSEVKVQGFGILPTGTSSHALNRLHFLLNRTVFNILPTSSKYIGFTTARK